VDKTWAACHRLGNKKKRGFRQGDSVELVREE
jgi:hypothetical protein